MLRMRSWTLWHDKQTLFRKYNRKQWLCALACICLLVPVHVYASDELADHILKEPIKPLSDQAIKQAFQTKPDDLPLKQVDPNVAVPVEKDLEQPIQQPLSDDVPTETEDLSLRGKVQTKLKDAFSVKPNSPAVAGAVNEVVTRPDDDLLIFSLNLGRKTLVDALLTYEDLDTGKYYIPLSDFVDALEFPIEVAPRKGTATGWFLNEERAFKLDLPSGTAVVDGKSYTLSPSEVERHEDGVYISLKQLQEWFPLTLDVDFSQLAIVVKSLEPLPIEVRLARDDRREYINDGKGYHEKEYPLQDTPVPSFTIPFVNTSAQTRYEKRESLQNPFSVTFTTLASGIVAGQDAEISINETTQDEDGPDIRATIGRKDLGNDLFGLGLSEYKLGDVTTRSIPLIASGSAGRGLYFTSSPLNSLRAAQSGQVQLRGELPVGYQVDVMRTGELLGFQQEPDENGEYVFDIDVFAGLNIFELVFYGPQGQQEVREERFYISGNPAESGEFDYSIDLIQGNTNLFTNRDSNDPDVGEYRFTGQAQYGLNNSSSLFGALSDLSIDGTRRRYGLLRYSKSLLGIRADVSYARSQASDQSGQAASLRLQGVTKGVRWQAEHEYFDDFTSEETDSSGLAGDLEHSTSFRASGLLPVVRHVPFSINIDREANTNGDQRIAWQGRVTKNIRKIRTTAEVEQVIEDGQERTTGTNLQLGSRLRNVSLRGSATLDVEPELELASVNFDADWRLNDRTSLRASIQRSGGSDPLHTLSLGASRIFDKFRLGVNASYNDDSEGSVLLSASFGLGYDPYKRRAFMHNERFARTAMFAPKTYYDKNGNSTFDGEDEWLKDIAFAGSGVDRNVTTGEDGYVLLTGVDPYSRASFELNQSSLPDPFMRSVVPPQDYILRPSQIIKAEYPVVLVGEVDGEIESARVGERRAGQSIAVQVVNPDNAKVVAEGKSEYDGFAWVKDVPMGEYTLRISPEQLKKLGYCTPKPRSVVLTTEEPFTSFETIMLWPEGQEGRVNVVLSNGVDPAALKAQWKKIKPFLEPLFIEREALPYVYIVKQGDGYHLMLHDMAQQAGIDMCQSLQSNGDVPMCSISYAKGTCPETIVTVEQMRIQSDVEKKEGVESSEANDGGAQEASDIKDS